MLPIDVRRRYGDFSDYGGYGGYGGFGGYRFSPGAGGTPFPTTPALPTSAPRTTMPVAQAAPTNPAQAVDPSQSRTLLGQNMNLAPLQPMGGGMSPQMLLAALQSSAQGGGAAAPGQAPPTSTPPAPGGGPGTPGMPQLAQVQTPSMQDAVQAYLKAVQGSYQPYFDQQQQQLKAQLASQGILQAGSGNQALQDLTAQQNAQVTGATAPLIQQGFGQNFQANTGNANSYNQALMQMVQNQLQAQLANANLGMQGQEFNANLVNNALMANTGYANNALFQGAGFGNNDYLNALQSQGGFLGSNLGALGYILGEGTSGGLNAYLSGQGLGAQYANQQGQNAGYQSGTPSSFIPNWSQPGGGSNYPSIPSNVGFPTLPGTLPGQDQGTLTPADLGGFGT